MAMEQQIIHCHSSAEQIEERLNRLGAEGWRLQDVSAPVLRKGGPAGTHGHVYQTDRFLFVMTKTSTPWRYRCRHLSRPAGPEQDVAALNAEIQAQNGEGFVLTRILHPAYISDNPERPTPGTIAHLCLFEGASDDQ
jgi:hypothetical protein